MEKTLKATRLTVCIFILGLVAGRAALAGDDVIVKEGTVIAAADVNAGTLKLSGGSITDSTGQISLGDENLITTGHLAVGSNAEIEEFIPFHLKDTYTGTFGVYYGQSVVCTHSPSDFKPTSCGLNFKQIWEPSGSHRINNLMGIQGIAQVSSAADSSDNPFAETASCMRSAIVVKRGSGAQGTPYITDARHFATGATNIIAPGYITNLYGFYDAGQYEGNNNWGFYGKSTNNALEGNLRIGSGVEPDVALDVSGDADISGNLNVNDVTVNGNSTVTATLTFSGGNPGDCSSITVTNGIITGYTTVPQ